MPAKIINISSARRAKSKNLKEVMPVKREHPIKIRLREMGGRSKGYTIEWLADESGISSATIRNFMAGRNAMLPYSFSKMLKVLSVNENYIYRCGREATQTALG